MIKIELTPEQAYEFASMLGAASAVFEESAKENAGVFKNFSLSLKDHANELLTIIAAAHNK